jgi:hypothetical protein
MVAVTSEFSVVNDLCLAPVWLVDDIIVEDFSCGCVAVLGFTK